jgi:undecaprenyl-diphosphatase
MNDFLSYLIKQDKALFYQINAKWTHPFFDSLMPWCRNANNWIPLYLFLLIFLFIHWKQQMWKWLLLAGVNVALTDQISSHLFKPYFHRLRPCADPSMIQKTRLLLEHCSGGFSFTSSHAANHFGIAMFIVMTLAPLLKKYRFTFFAWAALISYAQVYVGVHFPIDIIVGAIIGIVVGYFNGKIFLLKNFLTASHE